MRLRVRVIGAGTTDDPRRVTLPNYAMITDDPATNIAVIEVPDADVPEALRTPNIGDITVIGGRVTRTRLAVPDRARWRLYLDARYREHGGAFDPDVA